MYYCCITGNCTGHVYDLPRFQLNFVYIIIYCPLARLAQPLTKNINVACDLDIIGLSILYIVK